MTRCVCLVKRQRSVLGEVGGELGLSGVGDAKLVVVGAVAGFAGGDDPGGVAGELHEPVPVAAGLLPELPGGAGPVVTSQSAVVEAAGTVELAAVLVTLKHQRASAAPDAQSVEP